MNIMDIKTRIKDFVLREANVSDVPVILSLVRELADYEKLSHEVVATEEVMSESLFGDRKVAEAILGFYKGAPVSVAIFFHNFSTFIGRPGIYLEDLYP